MANFVGREKELHLLTELVKKRTASLVVIKGRRRIGKSRLVEELAIRYPFDAFYRFAGIAPTPETTKQSQREIFAGQLASQFGSNLDLIGANINDWSSLFMILSDKIRKGRILVLFDEISWMGSKDADFLGKLKDAWDFNFKRNDQLIFIICGSVSTWIEDNILSSTGYVGRVSLDLTLKELPLSDCMKFWGSHAKQIASYEKLKVLSVTGGIPLYLEHIRPDLSAEKNITTLCFLSSGLLFREFDHIFTDLFSRRNMLYKKIVESLATGSLTQEEINASIGYDRSSHISEYLEDLISCGFITKDQSWNLGTGRQGKLNRYRICDCYSRFYLRYIETNRHKIEHDHFQDVSISTLPQWNTIMGLQFETLVLNNRRSLWKALSIDPQEIVFDNPFFQNKTQRRAGCQIDYLIQTKYNTVYVCEIKFSQREIGAGIIEEVQKKITNLKLPKHFSFRPVLIHVNGITESLEETDYFTTIINFAQMCNDVMT
jgi:AAA+ ATPase superfamily predicted ATPase